MYAGLSLVPAVAVRVIDKNNASTSHRISTASSTTILFLMLAEEMKTSDLENKSDQLYTLICTAREHHGI
jgi:hypothetical protein